MSQKDETYIPALRYRWLTRFYDPVVALTTREQVFRRKLLGLIKCSAGDRVLDLACGTGTLTRMIKNENPSTTVHGLDGDPDILKLARRKSRQEKLDIHFDEGLSFSMPYADDSFDLVVSSLFFHHLTATNKQRALGRLPGFISDSGFKQVTVVDRVSTMLGTLDLITANPV